LSLSFLSYPLGCTEVSKHEKNQLANQTKQIMFKVYTKHVVIYDFSIKILTT